MILDERTWLLQELPISQITTIIEISRTLIIIGMPILCVIVPMTSSSSFSLPSFDNQSTPSQSEARDMYNGFASYNHKQGGKDADSGYGGPAVTAMLELALLKQPKQCWLMGVGKRNWLSSFYHPSTTPTQEDRTTK